MEDDGRGLVDTVMDLLGIDPSAIGENDNLAGMGIDSMQARPSRTPSPASWPRCHPSPPVQALLDITAAKLRQAPMSSGAQRRLARQPARPVW